MRLADLVETSRRVAEASGRTAKIGLLAELLRRLEGEEIDVGAAFLAGELRQGRIGIGWAALRSASPSTAAPEPGLTLLAVDEAFSRIAGASGRGSAGERLRLLSDLLSRATREEQDFLPRLVMGELRQGALAGILGEALARATEIPAAEVRRALMLAGDPRAVARALLAEGRAGLSRFALALMRPVEPMLAQTAEDVPGALERLGQAALEWKLDGARVQVHRQGEEVRVWSRRGHEVTPAVPELVEAVLALPVRQLILDGEVLALRPDGSPHPFQVTMRRFGRRLEVERLRAELPLSPFFFDVLHVDGEDLIDQPAAERFAALARALPAGQVVPRTVTADPAAAEAFLAGAVARGHEGIMAKALDAPYEAGRRGFSWLKVKRAHTLDLVILAVEWGSGRRRGWLSNLHLGARDEESGQFVMLGKTFKGLTDEMLAWQTARLLELETSRDSYTVYVRPELVAEIAFNDVQESPHYPGGMALRFARVKGYRLDKTAAEADTLQTVRGIFNSQGMAQDPGRQDEPPAEP